MALRKLHLPPPKKKTYHQKQTKPGLPWWYSGEESTCQCRRTGSILGQGTRSHAAELLRLPSCAMSPKLPAPAHLEPVFLNKGPLPAASPSPLREEPGLLQLKAHAATDSATNKYTTCYKTNRVKLPEAAERGPGLGLLCTQEARS